MSEWQRTIHLGKRDANEPAIRRVVEEEFGGKFVPISIKDGWDAIVGLLGTTELWEIKNGKGSWCAFRARGGPGRRPRCAVARSCGVGPAPVNP